MFTIDVTTSSNYSSKAIKSYLGLPGQRLSRFHNGYYGIWITGRRTGWPTLQCRCDVLLGKFRSIGHCRGFFFLFILPNQTRRNAGRFVVARLLPLLPAVLLLSGGPFLLLFFPIILIQRWFVVINVVMVMMITVLTRTVYQAVFGRYFGFCNSDGTYRSTLCRICLKKFMGREN